MSEPLLYYDPLVVLDKPNRDFPGISKFTDYFKIYTTGVSPVDRTHTIRTPVKMHSLFPLPPFRPFNKTFEEICNERAVELLQRAERLNTKIFTFWSGGIDSTLALVSLLKNASKEQKERITVLLSEDSIGENPRFYKEHVHGKLTMETSSTFPYLLGGTDIIVNGEHNDQVFGSDAIAKLISSFGPATLHQPYNPDLFVKFFAQFTNNEASGRFYMELFDKLRKAAPIDIATNQMHLWWINFTLKWQTVHMRTLSHVYQRRAPLITPEYRATYYAPFYCTDDFQLWSMNNTDKKIKDTWQSYKWVCKDIIYDYTGDAEYRDTKIKRGSLAHLVTQHARTPFIDASMHFHSELDVKEYYEPANDFV